MGSLLWTWLAFTASARAYMTNSLATSSGKCGDERPLMVSMLELEWPAMKGISVRPGAEWRERWSGMTGCPLQAGGLSRGRGMRTAGRPQAGRESKVKTSGAAAVGVDRRG